MVLEVHRNTVKDHLRNKSNNAIFPALELLDKIRDDNLHLGAQFRAPLAAYGRLKEELNRKSSVLGGTQQHLSPAVWEKDVVDVVLKI